MPAASRRRTGKLPPPVCRRAIVQSASGVADPDVGDTEGSGYDSELGGGGHSSKRQNKRPRTTKSTKRRTQRKVGKTIILPTLPLDIIFEIFRHLSPACLLNLARTNKAFQNTLMSREAITIWEYALKNDPHNVPACPLDISAPRWASLLFGGTTCQECGSRDAENTDFQLRRRVCTFCLKENLICRSDFFYQFRWFDPAMLELIPYTKTGVCSHYHGSSTRFYSKADIHAMAAVFGQHQTHLVMCKRGAKAAFKKFRESRLRLVKDATKRANICFTLEPLAVEDCSNALHALPGVVSQRADRLRREMSAMLPDEEDHEDGVPETDRLALATSVFTCTWPRCKALHEARSLVAWSGVMSHQCYSHAEVNDLFFGCDSEYKGLQVAFSERGSAAVASLIRCLNEGPDEVTPQDLDVLDRRYVCVKCEALHYNRIARTWRECIEHALDNNQDQTLHATPKWLVLLPSDEKLVKKQEHGDQSYQQMLWSCAHCSIHLNDLQMRDSVVEHVEQIHAIAKPQEDKDFFYATPSHRPRPFSSALDSSFLLKPGYPPWWTE